MKKCPKCLGEGGWALTLAELAEIPTNPLFKDVRLEDPYEDLYWMRCPCSGGEGYVWPLPSENFCD